MVRGRKFSHFWPTSFLPIKYLAHHVIDGGGGQCIINGVENMIKLLSKKNQRKEHMSTIEMVGWYINAVDFLFG